MKALAASALFLLSMQQPQPPDLLTEALKLVADVKLIGAGAPSRWIVQDFDGDKRPDVAAVVVRRSARQSEFGVIAVHARAPEAIHWVVPLDADEIHGIASGKAADTIAPVFCAGCDSNVWLRWSGEDYEAELHAIGEEIEIGGETEADVPLYSSANPASKAIALVPHCTNAVVRKVGGTAEKRWYFVETPDGQQGWVADDVTSAANCPG